MNFAYFLVVEDGPMLGESVELEQGRGLVLGRQEDCDFHIRDVNMSRQHARITLKDKVVTIEDLNSQNGIFLEGKRINSPTELPPGANITMGQQRFVVRLTQVENRWVRLFKQNFIALKGLPEHRLARVRYPSVYLEATVYSGLALAIVGALGIQEAGFFGLFLAAASLFVRFEAVLAANKHDIFVLNLPANAANLKTANSILMMFLGVCTAYFVMTLSYTDADLSQYFGFIFDNVQLKNNHIFNRDFSSFTAILMHNATVSLVIIVLCCLYRSYAALLALGWNAATWVVVLVSLTRRVLEADVLNPTQVSAMVLLAVSPHLVLEALAYILVALAAIWYSKGVTKYALTLTAPEPISEASFAALKRPQDQILRDITVSCFKILVLGVIVLLVAAMVEAIYAPWMLDIVKSSVQR